MTLITIAFIAFVAGLLFFGSLPYFSMIEKRKKEKLFLRLSREGAANNLTFCSQEILRDTIIGIDGIHRKIMILGQNGKNYDCSVISLDEVQHCKLVTNEGVIEAEELQQTEVYKKPCLLKLQFELCNHSDPASIVFADGYHNSQREFALLSAKAAFWCQMFSKMLQSRMVVRA